MVSGKAKLIEIKFRDDVERHEPEPVTARLKSRKGGGQSTAAELDPDSIDITMDKPNFIEVFDRQPDGATLRFKVKPHDDLLRDPHFPQRIKEEVRVTVKGRPRTEQNDGAAPELRADCRVKIKRHVKIRWRVEPIDPPGPLTEDGPLELIADGRSGFVLTLRLGEWSPATKEWVDCDDQGEQFTHWLAPGDPRITFQVVEPQPRPTDAAPDSSHAVTTWHSRVALPDPRPPFAALVFDTTMSPPRIETVLRVRAWQSGTLISREPFQATAPPLAEASIPLWLLQPEYTLKIGKYGWQEQTIAISKEGEYSPIYRALQDGQGSSLRLHVEGEYTSPTDRASFKEQEVLFPQAELRIGSRSVGETTYVDGRARVAIVGRPGVGEVELRLAEPLKLRPEALTYYERAETQTVILFTAIFGANSVIAGALEKRCERYYHEYFEPYLKEESQAIEQNDRKRQHGARQLFLLARYCELYKRLLERALLVRRNAAINTINTLISLLIDGIGFWFDHVKTSGSLKEAVQEAIEKSATRLRHLRDELLPALRQSLSGQEQLVHELAETIRRLELDEIPRLERAIRELEESLPDLSRTSRDLETRLTDLRRQADDLAAGVAEADTAVQAARRRLDDLGGERAALEQSREAVARQARDIDDRFARATGQKDQALAAHDAALRQHNEAGAAATVADQTLQRAIAEREAAAAAGSDIRQQQAEAAVAAATERLAAARAGQQTAAQELASRQGLRDDALTVLDSVADERATAYREVTRLDGDLQRVRTDIGGEQNILNQQEPRLNDLTTRKADADTAIDNHTREKTQVDNDLAVKQQNLDQARPDLSQKRQELGTAERSLRDGERELGQTRTQLKDAETEAQQLGDQEPQFRQEAEKLREDLARNQPRSESWWKWAQESFEHWFGWVWKTPLYGLNPMWWLWKIAELIQALVTKFFWFVFSRLFPLLDLAKPLVDAFSEEVIETWAVKGLVMPVELAFPPATSTREWMRGAQVGGGYGGSTATRQNTKAELAQNAFQLDGQVTRQAQDAFSQCVIAAIGEAVADALIYRVPEEVQGTEARCTAFITRLGNELGRQEETQARADSSRFLLSAWESLGALESWRDYANTIDWITWVLGWYLRVKGILLCVTVVGAVVGRTLLLAADCIDVIKGMALTLVAVFMDLIPRDKYVRLIVLAPFATYAGLYRDTTEPSVEAIDKIEAANPNLGPEVMRVFWG